MAVNHCGELPCEKVWDQKVSWLVFPDGQADLTLGSIR